MKSRKNQLSNIYQQALTGVLIFGTAFLLVAITTMQREEKGLLALLRGDFSKAQAEKKDNAKKIPTLAKTVEEKKLEEASRTLTDEDLFKGKFIEPLAEDKVQSLLQQNKEISAIFDTISPSVVSINIGKLQNSSSLGQGSGVIVREDGYIITNYHVVAPSLRRKKKIHVELIDGKLLEANPIGVDPMVDLALLKVKSEQPLPALRFADSDQVRIGHKVFAFGNPYQLGISFSQGNISAKDRTITDMHHDLFQITAALNPGQSGGPLINVRGELIGINSAIYSTDQQSPSFQGIAFSIPSNTAKETMKSILKRERPRRGFLGIRASKVNENDRKKLGFQKKSGSILRYVAPLSPASDGGLKEHDIITHFNEKPIVSGQHFINLVKRSAKQEVHLTVWRDQKEKHINLTVGDISQAGVALPASANGLFVKIGIVPRNLNQKEKSKLFYGVSVEKVLEGTRAEGKVRKGDFIMSINNKPLRSVRDFIHLFQESMIKNRVTQITILRPGKGVFHLYFT